RPGGMASQRSSAEQEGDGSKDCAQCDLYPELWRDESARDLGFQGHQVHGKGPGCSKGQFGVPDSQDDLSELREVGAKSFTGAFDVGELACALHRPVSLAGGPRVQRRASQRDSGFRKPGRYGTGPRAQRLRHVSNIYERRFVEREVSTDRIGYVASPLCRTRLERLQRIRKLRGRRGQNGRGFGQTLGSAQQNFGGFAFRKW